MAERAIGLMATAVIDTRSFGTKHDGKKKDSSMNHGGFSRARIGRLHDVLTDHVNQGHIPGAVAIVDRRGETHVEAVGVQVLGEVRPMQRDTIFRISSMTKPITAAATMILVEECRLRLDDPVDLHLPELANRQVLRSIDSPVDDTVPANRPVTVRDLLTFTWGFGMVMAAPGTYPIQVAMNKIGLRQGPPGPEGGPAPDEWIRRIGTLPLMHQPGEKWMYGTGSDVLGILIRRASGQSFESFLAERLFGPLGMTDTYFSVPPEKIDRFVAEYSTDFVTGELHLNSSPTEGQWREPPAFARGSAGLVSTADDYLAFARMLRNNGKHGNERILSRSSVELMTTDRLTSAQKAHPGLYDEFFQENGWGFGLAITTRQRDLGPTPGSYGWFGGGGTSWNTDPAEQLTGILLTQASLTSPRPPAVFRDFWTTTYQALDD